MFKSPKRFKKTAVDFCKSPNEVLKFNSNDYVAYQAREEFSMRNMIFQRFYTSSNET